MQCLYQISGEVQAHRGRGQQLGVPTVNITAPTEVPDGVYAGWLTHQQHCWPAAIFVGAAITFGETDRQVEAHLLDVEVTLSGTVTLCISEFIRPNQQFPDAASLQRQMILDIEAIRQCLQVSSKN